MADKAATKVSSTQEKFEVLWANVDNTDTPTEFKWPGGKGFIEVRGTFDSAAVQMQFGTETGALDDLSTTDAPDGAAFSATTANIVHFNLPKGFFNPVFSGGGASQDVDVRLVGESIKL